MITMKNEVVFSKEIVWCHGDDRHILIMKEHDEIVGLNYCQGDDLEHFVDKYDEIDHDLTDFFNAIKPYLIHDNEVDKINAAIWAHFEYRNLRDSRKAL